MNPSATRRLSPRPSPIVVCHSLLVVWLVLFCLFLRFVDLATAQDSNDGSTWIDDTDWTTQTGTTTSTVVPVYQIQIDAASDPLYRPTEGGTQAVLSYFQGMFAGMGEVTLVTNEVWQTNPKSGALYFSIFSGEMTLIEEFDATGNLISSQILNEGGGQWTSVGEVIEIVLLDDPNNPSNPNDPNGPNDPNLLQEPESQPQPEPPTFYCTRPDGPPIDDWGTYEPGIPWCETPEAMALPEKEFEAQCNSPSCKDDVLRTELIPYAFTKLIS